MSLMGMTCKLCTLTECSETRTRLHITLFSSQLQSPNAFSHTSEPSWGWAFCAGCWYTLGFCGSPSLMGLNGKAKSLATEIGSVRQCWDFPVDSKYTSFSVRKRSGVCPNVVRRHFTRMHFSMWHSGQSSMVQPRVNHLTLHDLAVPQSGESWRPYVRQLKIVIRAGTLTWERIRLRVQLPTRHCETFSTLLDLSEPQFSLVSKGHDRWSSLVGPMWGISEIMYIKCFSQLPGTCQGINPLLLPLLLDVYWQLTIFSKQRLSFLWGGKTAGLKGVVSPAWVCRPPGAPTLTGSVSVSCGYYNQNTLDWVVYTTIL